MDEILSRKCTKCLEEKDFSNFSKKKWWLFWLRSICKSCDYEYWKNYCINNKDYVKERKRIYDLENKDKNREYRERNKDSIKIKKLKYQQSENWRLVFLVNRQKRRTRKQNVFNDGSVTKSNLDKLFIIQDHKCWYCWCNIDDKHSHLDHIQPISKWGSHTIGNVHWTCPKCNLSKWAKTHEEFLKLINK